MYNFLYFPDSQKVQEIAIINYSCVSLYIKPRLITLYPLKEVLEFCKVYCKRRVWHENTSQNKKNIFHLLLT